MIGALFTVSLITPTAHIIRTAEGKYFLKHLFKNLPSFLLFFSVSVGEGDTLVDNIGVRKLEPFFH